MAVKETLDQVPVSAWYVGWMQKHLAFAVLELQCWPFPERGALTLGGFH